jgi:TonB family protein
MLRQAVCATSALLALSIACAKPDAPSADPVIAYGDVEVLPARQSGPQLVYPPMLQEARIEGRVEIEFVVTAAGNVDSASFKILHSTNNALEAPTRTAVLGGRYAPGQNGGKAVPVRLRTIARFLTVHTDGSYDTAAKNTPTPLTAFYNPTK